MSKNVSRLSPKIYVYFFSVAFTYISFELLY